MPTRRSRSTSRCNSSPWHYRRMILVPRYMFLTMLTSLEKVSEPLDVHQHHQWQQQGQSPLQCVTQLPGTMEVRFWCPDICFWPCWIDWNRFQNYQMYTTANNNVNNMIQGYFNMWLSSLASLKVDLCVEIYVFDHAEFIGTGFTTLRCRCIAGGGGVHRGMCPSPP